MPRATLARSPARPRDRLLWAGGIPGVTGPTTTGPTGACSPGACSMGACSTGACSTGACSTGLGAAAWSGICAAAVTGMPSGAGWP